MTRTTKEGLLLQLKEILSKNNIKLYVNEVAAIREALLEENISDIEDMNITNEIREKVQQEALDAWIAHGKRGAIYIATGVGKSKIAVEAARILSTTVSDYSILLATPTERLRDVEWAKEFVKWDAAPIWQHVNSLCYQSLDNLINRTFEFAILDEAHNITPNNSKPFFNNVNQFGAIMALTATQPRDWTKQEILHNMGIKVVYELGLEEAVKLGITAPYEVTIIRVPLSTDTSSIKKWFRGRIWTSSEFHEYNRLTSNVNFGKNSLARIHRMSAVYHFRSKDKIIQKILNSLPPNERTLIFCGNKEQAASVSPNSYFTKPSKPKANNPIEEEKYHRLTKAYQSKEGLRLFTEGFINVLSCVFALNEGHNLGKIDNAIIGQINSTELDTIQRMGRILRYRPGHLGQVYILVYKDTVDEEWAAKATRRLDQSKIKVIDIQPEEERWRKHMIE